MAPRGKGKAKARTDGSTNPSTRSHRTTRDSKNAIPEVYREMLSNAADQLATTEPERPLKRRRLAGTASPSDSQHASPGTSPAKSTAYSAKPLHATPLAAVQTIEQSSDDDSDLAFEDVNLDPAGKTVSELGSDDDSDQGIADVSIALDQYATPERPKETHRKKPATAAEQASRLLVHKVHVLCLLAHCMFVNSWCNNSVVQEHVRTILSKRTVEWFNDKSNSQAARHLTFIEALQRCCNDFGQHFIVTASGMCAARWMDDNKPGNTPCSAEPMDLDSFISAAKKREGSQDVGNQLFCALLRSIGIDARLICSLQPLGFTSVSSKGHALQKPAGTTMYASAPHVNRVAEQSANEDDGVHGSKGIGTVPSARRRLGQPSFHTGTSLPPSAVGRSRSKNVRKLSYPVWWVEAFDEAYQKWIPVDALVTKTVNKASKLEPPSAYHELNHLTYVLAFESEGVARDVTRRYTKAFNAKTRRQRVESTENGTQWMKGALRVFRRRGKPLDRDQVEDAELAQKEAKEGLPSNVQDFKHHPYYALERHLKRHEVLHPRRTVGKVNAGTAAKPRLEAVFRRQDVLLCRSTDRWFRLGREVKVGEQPLKHVTTQRRLRVSRSPNNTDADAHEAETTALYAFAQTTLYVSPPVTRGRVPRNAFGNLDIYVPSMVPASGFHIRHALTQKAAALLHVHFADAVTGFRFKGRQGTAVIEGAVVPLVYAEAVKAVIEGMEWLEVEDASRTRSLLALRFWKRFLTGLKVRQRVNGVAETDSVGNSAHEMSDEVTIDFMTMVDERPLLNAGQYSINELQEATKQPRKVKIGMRNGEDNSFSAADETPETDMPMSSSLNASEDHDLDDYGGGFMPSDAIADVVCTVDVFTADADHGTIRSGGYLIPEDDQDDKEDLESMKYGHNFDDCEGRGSLPDDGLGGGGFVRAEESDRIEMTLDEARKSPVGDVSDDCPRHDEDHHNLGEQTDQVHPGHVLDLGLPGPELRGLIDLHRNEAPRRIEDESKKVTHMSELQVAVEIAGHNTGLVEESDRGSLLSHDPEDEDAEPDWLESD